MGSAVPALPDPARGKAPRGSRETSLAQWTLQRKVSCVILYFVKDGVWTVMSYGIVRVQKMSSGSVKGIQIHDKREKDHSHTNPDIDFSRSKENYDLCPKQNENFTKAVKERIDQLDLKRAVRKDAVVMAQIIVTSDSDFFNRLYDADCAELAEASHDAYLGMGYTPRKKVEPKDTRRQFFEDAYKFLSDRYGAENVISATVHMDERTPHMHFNFVPVTRDGRLSAKDVLTKTQLIDQQTAFYEQVGVKYGLDRGERKDSGKRRLHLETAEYKEAVALENEAKDRQFEAEMAASRAEQKASEAVLRAEKAQQAIIPLAEQKNALQGEIEALQDEVQELQEERKVLRSAIDSLSDEAAGRFTRESIAVQIEKAKAKAEKENRLSLLERFVSLPQIKPLFDKFCELMKTRHRDRNGREER